MMEDRFEELMRDAAHTYRKPPQPDLEGMWHAIEAEHFGARAGKDTSEPALMPVRVERGWSRSTRYLAIAATLVIGIALGRASTSLSPMNGTTPVPEVNVAGNTIPESQPYEAETSKYLGQTAALLIALPSEVRAGRADEQFVNRAGELLSRTRLLMDSPAADEPQMRNLLEDLELVLAQVVRLQNNTTSRTELDLISRALEQRDVIPRLRTAVADISAN
jgi:hypothetical protein